MLDRLGLPADARRTVEFLIRITCRCRRWPSGATPKIRDVVRQFADLVGTEERLKMLCLMTLVDIERRQPRRR